MKLLKSTADSATEAPRSLVWGFLCAKRKLSLFGESLTQANVSRFKAWRNLHNTARNIAGKSGDTHTCYFIDFDL
jgi:hypothetical protein